MAYIQKVIGSDEKLIGIARLHWIYIVKGLFGFLTCAFIGWAVNEVIFNGLMMLSRTLGRVDPFLPLLSVNSYLMPFMLAAGLVIFLSYLIMVLSTEIGLTSRRLIHKKGLIFIKMNETDVEEIRGENLDMGYLGRFLGYGYIKLDCRFIGDVRLPAIENATGFLKALHKVRSGIIDTLAVVTAAPPSPETTEVETIKMLELSQEPPQTPEQPAEPQPAEPQPSEPQPVTPPGPAPQQPPAPPEFPGTPERPPAPPSPIEVPGEPVAPPSLPPTPVEVPQPPSEIPSQPNPESPIPITNPPTGTQTLNEQTVARIVAQVVPDIVEKVAEKIADQGLIPQEDTVLPEEDLLDSFDEASTTALKVRRRAR